LSFLKGNVKRKLSPLYAYPKSVWDWPTRLQVHSCPDKRQVLAHPIAVESHDDSATRIRLSKAWLARIGNCWSVVGRMRGVERGERNLALEYRRIDAGPFRNTGGIDSRIFREQMRLGRSTQGRNLSCSRLPAGDASYGGCAYFRHNSLAYSGLSQGFCRAQYCAPFGSKIYCRGCGYHKAWSSRCSSSDMSAYSAYRQSPSPNLQEKV
jgi:hypothetical protein